MLMVEDLMTVAPRTIAPGTPVTEIVTIMHEEGFRQLPVVEDGLLVGIVTERDVRSVQMSAHLGTLSADSIMTTEPITVTPETPAYRAAELLHIYKFGALPVVDGQALVGILSVSDVLESFASHNSGNSGKTT
jgi:acetoin utilization protein AcuB